MDVIEDRLRVALGLYRQRGRTAKALVLAGGVAANAAIRATLARFAQQSGLPLVAPPLRLCTDNGAMIAWAGIERLRLGRVDDLSAPARARWPLDPNAERRAQQQGLARRPESGVAVGRRGHGARRRVGRPRGPLHLHLVHVMAGDAAADAPSTA